MDPDYYYRSRQQNYFSKNGGIRECERQISLWRTGSTGNAQGTYCTKAGITNRGNNG